MTAHLYAHRYRIGAPLDPHYRTACGRWVTNVQLAKPGGVTCRACKRSKEWIQ